MTPERRKQIIEQNLKEAIYLAGLQTTSRKHYVSALPVEVSAAVRRRVER